MKNLNELFVASGADLETDGSPPIFKPIDIVLKVIPTNINLEDGQTIVHLKALISDQLSMAPGSLRSIGYDVEFGVPLHAIELYSDALLEEQG